MTCTYDLVIALHDIDAYRDQICRNCIHGWTVCASHGDAQRCRLDMDPAGPEDGCDEFHQREDRRVAAEQPALVTALTYGVTQEAPHALRRADDKAS